MFEGYRIIFWGIFITTFHINIGPLQILPNFLGYFLIFMGIKSLMEEFTSEDLIKAKTTALLLGIYSLIAGVLDLVLSDSRGAFLPVVLLPVVAAMLELFLFYYLFRGSAVFLKESGQGELADSCVAKTRGYLLLFILLTNLEIVGLTFQLQSLLTVFAIAMICLRIWLMATISGLKNTVSDLRIQTGE
ncbi:hypothetical protein [Sinanaerobacter chloroacetimidivorans]|uniref:Uncharacterized protein n=1 Tax=Sinanaerobacter chloroacetimidivorans TaxID=2818044 RepID=A0A8J8B4A5_9FIRM|nr:hypothetical protein [Sinanaerobacter chloroacetimidivorans]MBR0599155.1 hypothetical protein [Sinanaerobacter chloroacetimidivorans]